MGRQGQERNGEAKESVQTDDSHSAGECGCCGKQGHKRVQCRKQNKDQGGKSPAETVQAVVTVSQIQSVEDDSIWVFAVVASKKRNARILVDFGADEHVCPTDVASPTPLPSTEGGNEGRSVGAEIRVTCVKSQILNMEQLVKQDHQFEAGPTGCKMSMVDRSVKLEAVKNEFSLGGLYNWHASDLRNHRQAHAPSRHLSRHAAPRGSSIEYLDNSSPVEYMLTR